MEELLSVHERSEERVKGKLICATLWILPCSQSCVLQSQSASNPRPNESTSLLKLVDNLEWQKIDWRRSVPLGS